MLSSNYKISVLYEQILTQNFQIEMKIQDAIVVLLTKRILTCIYLKIYIK